MTIDRLAIEIGMSPGGFHKMVKKDTLSLAKLRKISEILDVPLSYWFVEDDKQVKGNQISKGMLENVKYAQVAMMEMKERIQVLEKLLAEKDTIIRLLQERIDELKKR